MKKLLSMAAVGLALCGLFVSCASTGGSASTGSVHPREYTLDLAESATGTTTSVVKNPYDTNHQSDPALDFTKFIRKDKPQAGDTIHINYKFSADNDISIVRFCLIDPTVNYWLELAPESYVDITDVKAGEVYEGVQDAILEQDVKGEFKVYIQYNCKDMVEAGYAEQSAASVFTFYDVEGVETTDVLKELPASAVPAGPKTIKVDMNVTAALCEMKTGHVWVNGVEDMSKIDNYQADISIMSLLEDPLEPGDIIEVTWKGRADIDIPALKMFPVDHSKQVSWWKELIDDRSDENVTVATDIKAGEAFEVTKTFVIDTASVTTDVNLRVYYDYNPETKGPGPCTIIRVKD